MKDQDYKNLYWKQGEVLETLQSQIDNLEYDNYLLSGSIIKEKKRNMKEVEDLNHIISSCKIQLQEAGKKIGRLKKIRE